MPEFSFGLIADSAQVDSAGKLSVLGEFSYIRTTALPAVHPHMTVFARWEAEAGEVQGRKITFEVEILGPDGEKVLPKGTISDAMKWGPHGPAKPNTYRANAIFQITGILLRVVGGHVVQFYIDGKRNGAVHFYVAKVDAPPGNVANA